MQHHSCLQLLEKYDYDELEPERQQIIEQQFSEMMEKRRKRKAEIDNELLDAFSMDRKSFKNVEHPGKKLM